jgi:hypothetical protein
MPQEHQQARGALSPLSIKFFAYFWDHKQSCPWREIFILDSRQREGRAGRLSPRLGPSFPAINSSRLWRRHLAPHWFWAVIAIGCVWLLLFQTGVIKIRRR